MTWLLSCRVPDAPPAPFDAVACFTELATALSADDMEGRGLGTEGLEKAAQLVEQRFAAEHLGDLGVAYRQVFTAVTGVAAGPGNRMEDAGGVLVVGEDFGPLGLASSGNFAGEIVFVGYGIVAPELGYDDYAGVDVRGKVVLALRYEPGEDDDSSPFDGERPSKFSDLREKAARARSAGASALVLVSPAHGDDEDRIPPLVTGGPTERAGIPVLQVTRKVANRWLRRAGTDLGALRDQIDASMHPRSFPVPGVAVEGSTDLVPTEAQTRNVVAVLPGEGNLAKEYVLVGAHYDHLGHGGAYSLVPDSTAIHNGADDNASGTAAMVCAMTALARAQPADGPRRTVVGVAFSAAEVGLGGSLYWRDHPLVPLADTVAMVDLDMVGRVRDNRLAVLGTDSSPDWGELVDAAAAGAGLLVGDEGAGAGPSDHATFDEARVPGVRLFSGAHDQYHTPDDDAPLLNMAGGAQVTTFAVDLVRRLAGRPERLPWTRSGGVARVSGDARGYGAWLGTVPDMSAGRLPSGGVRIADVRSGGPADRAGLRALDVVVGLAGGDVQRLADLSFLLQDHKPGETVEVVVVRNGQRLTLHATLGTPGELGTAAAAPNNPLSHVESFSVGADPRISGEAWSPRAGKAVPELLMPDERHLADLRQLTFGGENAEAYWAPDGRRILFQRTPGPNTCDAQYVMDLTTGMVTRVSSGRGRTTCGYFQWPKGSEERWIYATTEGAGDECPPAPDRSQGYVWPLYRAYDLVWQRPGEDPVPFLPADGYDAEATACMKDGRVVFTSVRDGDLDLYMVNPDGTGLERLTKEIGYDGGAFFDPKCTGITWRASRPTGAALVDYKKKLAEDLVEPSQLEIYWMDLKTRKVEQLTNNGAANFGPYPLPDARGVVFSSNMGSAGPEFDIYLVRRGPKVLTTPPERITTAKSFDGFPMFSPNGQFLVFGSNRATPEGKRDTNLFVARWVP